jgi:hypothetical protein
MPKHLLRGLLVVASVSPILAGGAPIVGAQHAAPIRALTPRDSALHALNRLAYGPRPGEVERVAALGVMHWIDRQLSPDALDDRLLAEREQEFRLLRYDAGDLARLYATTRQQRRERKREVMEPNALPDAGPEPGPRI